MTLDEVTRQVMARLLVESRLDTLARQAVKQVVGLIRQNVSVLGSRFLAMKWDIEVAGPGGRTLPCAVKAYVRESDNGVDDAEVSGGYSPDTGALRLTVTLFTASPDRAALPVHIGLVQRKAYDPIRHELEHAAQPSDVIASGAVGSEALASSRSPFADAAALRAYLTSRAEVEAFVVGLHHQARRLRRPFKEVIDDRLAYYVKAAKAAGMSDEESDRLFNDVRSAWMEYARQRFAKDVR